MSLLRTSFLAFLVATSAPTFAVAASSGPGNILSAQADDSSGYELLTQSRVGFWRGMSRAEFEERTLEVSPTKRVVSLGEFQFNVKGVEYDLQENLVSVSIEYRSDDAEQIERAYAAYKRALGDLKPDYVHSNPNGTPAVPDLKFEMMGWRSPEGGESALARVHSNAAKAKGGNVTTAGIVTFAIRRR